MRCTYHRGYQLVLHVEAFNPDGPRRHGRVRTNNLYKYLYIYMRTLAVVGSGQSRETVTVIIFSPPISKRYCETYGYIGRI